MGAKTWMLVASAGRPGEFLRDRPQMDRSATAALAKRLFSSERLVELTDGDLTNTCPPDDVIVAACYPGVSILAAAEFGIDRPSTLPGRCVDAFPGQSVYLHAMHSAVDWFAFAMWEHGQCRRALSLSPDNGLLEDIGEKLPFERAFWAGEHPALDPDEEDDAYPFPFHPLELGEAALGAMFDYHLEGYMTEAIPAPEAIGLMRFQRKKSWWRIV